LISLVTFSSNFFSFILWYSNILKVNYKEEKKKKKKRRRPKKTGAAG
jgi:hypothetical protein